MAASVVANGRRYALPSARPVVAVCLDGNEHDYVRAARSRGLMPNWERMEAAGSTGIVRGAMPSFTNPNNIAIVTGAPPAVNGICGNFYYDTVSGEEVMMNDASLLRCETLLSALATEGTPVLVVTAKKKLEALLTDGLPLAPGGESFGCSCEGAGDAVVDGRIAALLESGSIRSDRISVSSGSAGSTSMASLVGREAPTIYDPEASVFVLEAGASLLEAYLSPASASSADDQPSPVAYLSTTDFVQHKYAPEEPEALQFYGRIDEMLGRLHDLGAVVGVTADHGMNDKTVQDGQPGADPAAAVGEADIIFVETVLREAGYPCRAILPITDPYVVHHGALGSFATLYLEGGAGHPQQEEQVAEVAELLEAMPGVQRALTRAEAAERYELPPDRIGDVVVVSERHTVLGRTPEHHDLSQVPRLRSHGGETETLVPMLVNRPLRPEFAQRLAQAGELRNFDIFDVLLNGVQH